MEDQQLYDEFGNYIGPDLGDSDESLSQDEDSDDWDALPRESHAEDLKEDEDGEEDEEMSQAIVLHEDKQYYPAASEVYPGAEIRVQEEDTQPLETPIIAPFKKKCFELVETELPNTTFSYKFLAGLMDNPMLIRNIAIVGHLHHGKTSFVDMLVKQTHSRESWRRQPEKDIRYTDMRLDEQHRQLSIKAVPISLVLPDLREKSYLVNTMDCPGHVNFSDEMTAGLRLADGACIVVDVAEGVLMNTERAIRHAVAMGLPICVILNKMDRLILELKLPPKDAYLKLTHVLSEVNKILIECNHPEIIDPRKGNLLFASSRYGWSFTLRSFAKLYTDFHGVEGKLGEKSYDIFAKRLWGDVYLHKSRKFSKTPETDKQEKTFLQFILNPLYKIYSHVLGKDPEALGGLLSELGVRLSKKELDINARPLLTLILTRFFGNANGFVDMLVNHVPAPADGNKLQVERNYTGDITSRCGVAMLRCNPSNTVPPMVNITKMYPRPDASAFDAFGRVFSGTLKVGDQVRVLREGYSLDDEEDMSVKTITNIWIYQGRYRVEINRVRAGNWALFGGIDAGITKTATITHTRGNDDACIFRPLQFNTISTIKIAIEPIKPSELPKMVEGLRSVNKSFPLLTTKVEESGEHIVIGTGELYLDVVLRDLRKMYSEIEIKISDPVVSFCETVVDTSQISCFSKTPNGKNKLWMICEPLQKGVAEDIEHEKVKIDWEPKKLATFFKSNYQWDTLAARSIWAFGPDTQGPNILQDDTLPGEVDKTQLNLIRNSVVQGFQWGTREGPLCDEPIRNCRFKLINAQIAEQTIDRSSGQVIPTARRVLYSSFLLANPQLMEPILHVEIQCPADCVQAVMNVLKLRRGHLNAENPKPGTPFYVLHAAIPAIDAFGFETDLRTHTLGQAFCMQVFKHWDLVPGDPMDESIKLVPLEPSPAAKLAREFMVKTRKRKGLSEGVSPEKFYDDEMLQEIAKHDAEMADDD